MSDSNRSRRPEDLGRGFAIIITIGLCCLITGVLTHAWINNTSGDSERAAYHQQEAERNAESICVGRAGGLLAECLVEQRRASHEAYTAEQDLNAQRNMALWAMWMVVVSVITAGVTIWALFYVRETLIASREAVDAAIDTNQAYTLIESGNIKVSGGEQLISISHPKVAITATAHNIGRASCVIDGFEYSVSDTDCYPAAFDNRGDWSPRALEPGKKTTVSIGNIRHADLPKFVKGRLDFRDAVSGKRSTYFVLEVDGTRPSEETVFGAVKFNIVHPDGWPSDT